MKKILIILIVLVLLATGVVWFAKNKSTNSYIVDNTTMQNQNTNSNVSGDVSALSHLLVFKTKHDYGDLVWVGLSVDKTEVIAYPSPQDMMSKLPIKLHNDYYTGPIGTNVAFINLHAESYAKGNRMFSAEQLYSLIINKDPFSEMYDCGAKTNSSADIDSVNNLIDTKTLVSECKKIL